MDTNTFKNNILELRRFLGLDQNNFAVHLDRSNATVSRWESGEIKRMSDQKAEEIFILLRNIPGFPKALMLEQFLKQNLTLESLFTLPDTDVSKVDPDSLREHEDDDQEERIYLSQPDFKDRFINIAYSAISTSFKKTLNEISEERMHTILYDELRDAVDFFLGDLEIDDEVLKPVIDIIEELGATSCTANELEFSIEHRMALIFDVDFCVELRNTIRKHFLKKLRHALLRDIPPTLAAALEGEVGEFWSDDAEI